MKGSRSIAVIITLLAFVGQLQAGDPEGFRDMPFGMSQELVKKKLVTEFNMRRKFPMPMAPLSCRQGIDLQEEDGRIELVNYPYAGRRYRAILHFNRNGKLYGYMLEGAPYGEHDFTEGLQQEVVALSKDYYQRYGPEGRLEIDFQGVAERAETRFPVRDDDGYIVSTGVARRRAVLGSGTNLIAIVVVCDKELRDEPEQADIEDAQALAEEPRRRGRRSK